MKIYIDSDIFISLIENSAGAAASQALLNLNDHDLGTGLLNLLEIRTVLTKKKKHRQKEVETILQWLRDHLDFVIDDVPPLPDVNERQIDTLLYPMDCLICETADVHESLLSTYDRELIHHGCVHPKYLI